jgi:ubiquinone/menaquinone biosynthesis C-methylase UbiE/8-oxo-dGTP pyrophosphatase MutT (NUDIX family)
MFNTAKSLLGATAGAVGNLIEKHLNRAGEQYLDSINDTRPESTVAMMERLSPLLMHISDGAKVVSIGVGQGEEICGLYELFGDRISIVGVDISSVALEKTKARLQRNQFAAELINADAALLPFENGSVDAIVLSSTLHEVFSYHEEGIVAFKKAIQEVSRVLKKDGVVFIRDFAAPDTDELVSFRVRSPIAIKFYEYFRTSFRRFSNWGAGMEAAKLDDTFYPPLGHGVVHIPFSKAAELVLHFRSFWSDYQAGATSIGNTSWKEIDEMYIVRGKHSVLTPAQYLEMISDVLGDQFTLVYKRLRDRSKTNTFLTKHFSIYTTASAELIPKATRKLECIFQKHPTVKRHYAAAVIFDLHGRVLLCRRSLEKKIAPGKWHLPGGTVEFHESPVEAVTRELDEELGLKSVNVLPTTAQLTYEIAGSTHRTHVLWVEVSNSPELKNAENDQFEFVPYDDFSKYLEPNLVQDNQHAVLLARRVRDNGGTID